MKGSNFLLKSKVREEINDPSNLFFSEGDSIKLRFVIFVKGLSGKDNRETLEIKSPQTKLGLAFDWLRRWRTFSRPITE